MDWYRRWCQRHGWRYVRGRGWINPNPMYADQVYRDAFTCYHRVFHDMNDADIADNRERRFNPVEWNLRQRAVREATRMIPNFQPDEWRA